ncbi:9003_t:CDS:2, partial [Ambispora gerdemannii]
MTLKKNYTNSIGSKQLGSYEKKVAPFWNDIQRVIDNSFKDKIPQDEVSSKILATEYNEKYECLIEKYANVDGRTTEVEEAS